jgi:membrane associated rhomboid family serine protease/Tfp pilus assembly protein PilF
LANCRQCGTELPSFTFGEASPYCKNCRTQVAPAAKPALDDVLAPVATPLPRIFNATNILIAINVLVYAGMVATGISWLDPRSDEVLRWGANYGPYTLTGQYWRIISCSFLHFGIVHIGLNMWCLWALGRLAEKLLGSLSVFATYVVTGMGAALLSLTWDPMRVSAGASGAIFGFAGVLIAVLYYGKLNLDRAKTQKLLAYVVKFALINLLYGLRGGIDNMAHLGGLVTGLLAGIFLARSFSLQPEERNAQRRQVFLTAACIVPLLLVPLTRTKKAAMELGQAELAIDHSHYEAAITHLQSYIALVPDSALAHGQLGYCYHHLHRFGEAMAEYEHGLAQDPDMHWVQLDLARLYVSYDRSREAVVLFRRASLSPDWEADDYKVFGIALKDTGQLAEAEEVLRKSIAIDPNDAGAHGVLSEVLQGESKTGEAARESKVAKELERQPNQAKSQTNP